MPTLYDYQEDGVNFLLNRRKALLADEMGLGKTAQVLTTISRGGPNQRIIVVCPASVRGVWQRESSVWAPEYRGTILTGKGSFRLPAPGEIVIVSYESLPDFRKDARKYPHVEIPRLRESPITVIADEAHALKNSKSLRRNAFRALTRGIDRAGGRTWLLTATPMLNDSPNELWNVLNAAGGLANDAFGTWETFVEVFGGERQFLRVRPCFDYPNGLKPIGYEWGVHQIESAMPYLGKVMLRRKREDVKLQLPGKTRQVVPIEVDAGTKALIDEIVAESGENWTDEFIESLFDRPIQFKTIAKLRAKLAERKTSAMLELVEEYVDAKEPLVVFSAHLAPLRALAKKFKCPLIVGDVDGADRTVIVADFQAGKTKLLGATIKAGGVGITLTAASHGLFVDSEWTPSLNLQCEDRLYRISQERHVLIKYLVADHIVDERVTSVLLRKQAMIEKAGL